MAKKKQLDFDESGNQAIKNHYNQLNGLWNIEVIYLENEDDTDDLFDSPQIILSLTRGETNLLVEVLSDEEGNGTGFLEIMETKK